MEAPALCASATSAGRDVVCVAHATNTMATDGDDFEKGEAGGAVDALEIVAAIVERLRSGQDREVTIAADPSPSPREGGW